MQTPPNGDSSELARWMQIVFGLLIATLAVFCSLAALVTAITATSWVPAVAVGTVAVLSCSWVLMKAFRLILGRPLKGGLLSPTALRVAAFVVLCLPVCGLFTGYFAAHRAIAPIQSLLYIGISYYLWRLARHRATRERSI